MGVKMGGKDGDFGKLETTSRSVRFAIHFQSIHQLGALVDLESSFFANFFLFFFAMILWSSDQLSYKSLFELFFKSKETKPQFDFDCVDLSIFTYCFFLLQDLWMYQQEFSPSTASFLGLLRRGLILVFMEICSISSNYITCSYVLPIVPTSPHHNHQSLKILDKNECISAN